MELSQNLNLLGAEIANSCLLAVGCIAFIIRLYLQWKRSSALQVITLTWKCDQFYIGTFRHVSLCNLFLWKGEDLKVKEFRYTQVGFQYYFTVMREMVIYFLQ